MNKNNDLYVLRSSYDVSLSELCKYVTVITEHNSKRVMLLFSHHSKITDSVLLHDMDKILQSWINETGEIEVRGEYLETFLQLKDRSLFKLYNSPRTTLIKFIEKGKFVQLKDKSFLKCLNTCVQNINILSKWDLVYLVICIGDYYGQSDKVLYPYSFLT